MDEVLRKIQADEEGWENSLPSEIAKQIKTGYLFGYPKTKKRIKNNNEI